MESKENSKETISKANKRIVFFGEDKLRNSQTNSNYFPNEIITTKYNIITWLPKSLLIQFFRFANLFFLLICILTFLPISPKKPGNLTSTFSVVLILSMLKEAYEDIIRYQSDRKINLKETQVYRYSEKRFVVKPWKDVRVGNIVKVQSTEELPCDIMILKTSSPLGICFVDTKSLDGESSLKEKTVFSDIKFFPDDEALKLKGIISCDEPNNNLEKWDAFIKLESPYEKEEFANIKNILLKGSTLRNTDYIIGVAIYTGHSTKINQNDKPIRAKVSNLMRIMNYILYSLFGFLFLLCFVYSFLFIHWQDSTGKDLTYFFKYTGHVLSPPGTTSFDWFKKVWTFHINYSQLIPISIYITLESLKLFQARLIAADNETYDYSIKQATTVRSSELVEELGQVNFVFLDKTGTLTKNEMIFNACSINNKVYNYSPNNTGEKQENALSISDGNGKGNHNSGNTNGNNNQNNNKAKETGKGSSNTPTTQQQVKVEIQQLKDPEKNYFETEKKYLSNNNSNNEANNLKDSSKQLLKQESSKVLCSPFLQILQDPEHPEYSNITDFLRVCVLCHDAYIEEGEKGKVYSPSPDEVALINFSNQLGFSFVNRTSNRIKLSIEHLKQTQIWNLELLIKFQSERKRMSVIVRREDSDEYFLFSKGADQQMLASMAFDSKDSSLLNSVHDHLNSFAKQGLRTLVFGKKPLSKDLVDNYKTRYHEALMNTNNEAKEALLCNLYAEIESNLLYVGCSAIEDELQDNVGFTIETLLKVDIKIWMITGDKKETAFEIARTCKLMNTEDLEILDFTYNREDQDSKAELTKKIDYWFGKLYLPEEEESLKSKGKWSAKNTVKAELENESKKYFAIIDGINFAYLTDTEDDYLRRKFFRIAILCVSVICCRVSPNQKAEVIKMSKENGDFISLAIGDGENDVPMLMTANIGIGIYGKEGCHAIRTADYSIAQFQFLRNLLFVHGRLAYKRISTFICYYFYKSIVMITPEIIFAIYNGFSGQIFYPDFLPMLYNKLFTIWAGVCAFAIDRDVVYENSLKYHLLYKAGHINQYFSFRVYWSWIVNAFIHGILIFFLGVNSIKYFFAEDGLTFDMWFTSTIIFTCVMHIVTYKLFVEIRNWNLFNM